MFLWSITAVLTIGGLPLAAADLSKIDRTIGKEPAYKSKPKYCLVVVGPRGKTRVWLVLDHNVLFIDRKCNGDLTVPDDRLKKEFVGSDRFPWATINPPNGGESFDLRVGAKAGEDGQQTNVRIEFLAASGKCRSQRTDGVLVFADRPQDAPIVHFAGDFTLTILDWHKPLEPRQLVRDDKEHELSILVGTPVFANKHQAFATVNEIFRALPEAAGFPTMEFEFPGKETDRKSIRTQAKMRY
jgi:hypothetical protein